MSGTNSWLTRQRKSDLVDLAAAVGLKDYESLRKSDLESALDEHLSDHATRYQADSRFTDYFKSRARAGGSPVKKEAAAAPELKVSRRRTTSAATTKAADEITAADDDDDDEEDTLSTQATHAVQAASTALVRTPGRALSLASRIQLPATPADVAQAVDRGTVAVRERVSSLYAQSRIPESAALTREALSTVHSVLSAIALFELYRLRQEVLPDRYAFTVPAVRALGTHDYPVHLPDMFALVTASFWSPALTWALTSLVLPGLFGYFFNLSAAHNGQHQGRGRRSSAGAEYAVDPLAFSIAKAVVTYVVYAQGVTFGGLVNPDAVARINSALYSGWRGVLAGTAVSAVTAVYDAVLRK